MRWLEDIEQLEAERELPNMSHRAGVFNHSGPQALQTAEIQHCAHDTYLTYTTPLQMLVQSELRY
jgi:hypothetical protein